MQLEQRWSWDQNHIKAEKKVPSQWGNLDSGVGIFWKTEDTDDQKRFLWRTWQLNYAEILLNYKKIMPEAPKVSGSVVGETKFEFPSQIIFPGLI